MREIKNFEHYKIDENGNIFNRFGKKIKPSIINSGYLKIDLFKDKKRYQFLVHRLVALNFLENVNNFKCVNHKDKNKLNNNVDNLEWCTYKYNLEYSDCIKNANLKTRKKIKQIKEGKIIKIFNSAMEAQKELNISNSNINECCNRKRKSAGGFLWEFV